MIFRSLATFLLTIFPIAALQPSASLAEEKISFVRQVAPILQKHCIACHGAKKAESDYRADSFQALMQETSEGPAFVGGKLDASHLYQRLVTEDADLRMPPESDPLPTSEIETVKRWIEQGLEFDGSSAAVPLAELLPVITHPDPPDRYPASLPVSAMLILAKQERVLVGGYHEILVWDFAGSLKARIRNQGQRTYSIAMHPSKPLILSASGTPGQLGEVRMFDLDSFELRGIVAQTDEVIMDAQFSPDGSRIAVAMPERAARVYSGSDYAEKERELLGHSDQVTSLTWYSGGNRLATTSRDHTAKVFDVERGESIATFTRHSACVNDISFAGDKTLLSVSSDGSVMTWNAENGKRIKSLVSGKQSLLACSVRQDKALIVGEQMAQWIDARNGQKLENISIDGWCNSCDCVSGAEDKNVHALGTHLGRILLRKDNQEIASFPASPR